MESFKEFVGGSERVETVEELEEGALRSLGAAALFTRVLAISKRVRRTKDVNEQNALLASQITSLAAVVLAVGDFVNKQKS